MSVRDPAEAGAALEGGADWIDLKEPRGGALGAVPVAQARALAAQVAGAAPLSAAAGELNNWNAPSHPLLAVEGIGHIKLGLAGCREQHWQARWLAAQRDLAAAGRALVAVIYADAAAADAPPPREVLKLAVEAGAPWLLWDTFDKSGPPLTEQIEGPELARQLTLARDHGLHTVVAGRLETHHLARLPHGAISMIAVRGAVCRGGRGGEVVASRVAALREALDALTTSLR
ncbi:MAG TPA: (5-formylfuran-3-yl)methyl phosphate synthase [Lacipirellulaceae bacterium]|nr:(5-formylfuran-3-yl)methyl phosphate synthase [Lacipirellulaceae bacterium]